MKLLSRSDLRIQFAWRIAILVLIIMGFFSFWQYQRETKLIRTEMADDGLMTADVMLLGLRHAMLLNDPGMVRSMVDNVMVSEDIQRVTILDSNGVVKADNATRGNETGIRLDPNSPGCVGCHRYSAGTMPKVLNTKINGLDSIRIASVIANSPECYKCHGSSQKYLGVLLVDLTNVDEQAIMNNNILINIGLSILATLSISVAIYILIDLLATRRIKAFMGPLSSYSTGNYNVRLPVSKSGDELDRLAMTFNEMITEIEMHIEEESRRGELLSKAVVEERERIARELHDGLPQLLAYLNTKIGAISLFVKNGRKSNALSNLSELEDASRDLLTDVRDAIHGLRASRLLASGLPYAISNYLDQFRELCNIPVVCSSDPQLKTMKLAPEIEVQALRIVQEALSNVRKHSGAKKASVQMRLRAHQLVLVIKDDGTGFDPAARPVARKSNYGLQTMRERTESLAGKFVIKSKPGKGTTITVSLPLKVQDKS